MDGGTGTSAPLPSGEYRVVVSAVTQEGQSEKSARNDPNSRVALVEVKEVKFQSPSGSPALQPNTGPGGGSAIFAEAMQPNSSDVYDKMHVVATVFPPVNDLEAGDPPINIYFRSVDVDDPSSDQDPIDDETDVYDNQEPDLSQGPSSEPPPPGLLLDAAGTEVLGTVAIPLGTASPSTLTVASDEALTTLRVSRRQGDNYRVAASTSQAWVDALDAVKPSNNGSVEHPTGPQPTANTDISEMLTVWRTLFLQSAPMAPSPQSQSAFEYQATAACSTPPCIQGSTLVDTNGIPHPDHHFLQNTWTGADLDVTPATPRTDKHTVQTSTQTSLAALTTLTPFDPAYSYALWDDDVASQAIWSEPNDTLARSVLSQAYIRLEVTPGISPAWKQNLDDFDVASLLTSSSSLRTFWTAPIILAFEAIAGNPAIADGQDCDPPSEECRFGLANGDPPSGTPEASQPKIAIYPETIRDYSATPLVSPSNRVSRDELLTNTVAHEILHLFGLRHDGDRAAGGLMCAILYVDASEANRTKVTPNQLRELRDAIELKIRRTAPTNPCPTQ